MISLRKAWNRGFDPFHQHQRTGKKGDRYKNEPKTKKPWEKGEPLEGDNPHAREKGSMVIGAIFNAYHGMFIWPNSISISPQAKGQRPYTRTTSTAQIRRSIKQMYNRGCTSIYFLKPNGEIDMDVTTKARTILAVQMPKLQKQMYRSNAKREYKLQQALKETKESIQSTQNKLDKLYAAGKYGSQEAEELRNLIQVDQARYDKVVQTYQRGEWRRTFAVEGVLPEKFVGLWGLKALPGIKIPIVHDVLKSKFMQESGVSDFLLRWGGIDGEIGLPGTHRAKFLAQGKRLAKIGAKTGWEEWRHNFGQ